MKIRETVFYYLSGLQMFNGHFMVYNYYIFGIELHYLNNAKIKIQQ